MTVPDLRKEPGALSHRWIVAVLVAEAAGLVTWPPSALLIADEGGYVNQALAFSRGHLTLPGGVIFPAGRVPVMSDYPPGTALLQAPFVAAFGWQGAILVSAVSLLAATIFTVRLLGALGLRREFALLVPAYAGSLFFGRAAMSDVPSAAMVALGLWLLLSADRARWMRSFAAGAVIAASILFRELNIVLLAPFAVGALVRRACVSRALVAGGVTGVAARLVVSHLVFGSAFYLRDPGYGFSMHAAWERLGSMAFLVIVVCPLAGALPLLYRGPRRAEAATALTGYLGVLLFYEYDSVQDSGAIKGLLLASRFLIPALPVTTMMSAEVFPRLTATLSLRVRIAVAWMTRSWALAVVALAFFVHAAITRESRVAASIVQAIQSNTTYDVPLITNSMASLKYISPAYGLRRVILRDALDSMPPDEIERRFGRTTLVLLDRNDAPRFLRDAQANARSLARFARHCALRPVLDRHVAPWGHLRIFEMSRCAT